MRKHGMLLAIGLLVLVNAIVLTGIVYNRSGEPSATITLTERELPLVSYYRYDDRENTGLSLRLDWSKGEQSLPWGPSQGERAEDNEKGWFDKTKLEAIGFDCSLPVNDPKAEVHYQRMLPRKTFVVLEYEGSAWKAWLEKERKDLAETETKAQKGAVTQEDLKRARSFFNYQSVKRSRLYAIDAANDAHALRMQYNKPGRYLILSATVQLNYDIPYTDAPKKKGPPRLFGRISDILNDIIYIPKNHRPILEKLLRSIQQKNVDEYESYLERERGPAYEVKICVGKRAEPWIAAIRELAPAALK
jgi:hypothetical protein